MKKRMILCLTALFVMLSSISAQMVLWQNGKQILAADPERVDSLTFAQTDMVDIAFTFSLQDAKHLLITPSRNDVDYIWVATSDADYAYYDYASYAEAWQYTVDKAQMSGALEEWNMIDRGPSVVDLTDNTWDNTHYVITVAAWNGEIAYSAFSTCEFNLTDGGAVLANTNANLSAGQTLAGKTTVMQFWQKGEMLKSLALNRVDSATFILPEPDPMFTLSVSEITNISFLATVEPIDDQTWYFFDYVQKSVADGYTDDEFAQAYLEQLLLRWQYYYPDKSFADAFLYQGAKSLRFSDGVMGDTEYYLVCFAVDITDNTLASGLYKTAFKTDVTPKNPDLTFTVTVGERYIATITPSDNTSTYYWGYYGPTDIRQYGSPEEAWKANVEMHGLNYSSHGEEKLSLVYQAREAGLHYLVIGGYDGEQTSPLTVFEYTVTEDMLPF